MVGHWPSLRCFTLLVFAFLVLFLQAIHVSSQQIRIRLKQQLEPLKEQTLQVYTSLHTVHGCVSSFSQLQTAFLYYSGKLVSKPM